MKNKILIFGNGWLGNKYKNYFGASATITSTDIGDKDAVAAILEKTKPQIVINTAGKTGRPNVDWCESHKEETVYSNIAGALVLAHECMLRDIQFVHLSSGCLFQGDNKGKGWSEDDKTTPPNFYAWTKFMADEILKQFPVLILRLRMPIDKISDPRNLINKLATYKKIIDVENSVTIVEDLLYATDQLIQKKKTGIYHIVNPGTVRHRDILAWYKKYVDPKHTYEMIPLKKLQELGLTQAGRSNCILNTNKLKSAGVKLRPAKAAIIEALKEYKKVR